MIRWKRFLNRSVKADPRLRGLCGVVFSCLLLVIFCGCQRGKGLSRDEVLEQLPMVCLNKHQTYVTCQAVGDTLWVYLPYTKGRRGRAGVVIKDDQSLHLEYTVASFNPFRVKDPPELRFLVQRILREIRALQLKCEKPYVFFELVVSDIEDSLNRVDQCHIAYFDDLKKYKVGFDFSGEGYSRLVWYQEEVEIVDGSTEEPQAPVSASFRDAKGTHVKYHDVTMREFIERQIKWRIYKRFTIEYNKTPFNLSAKEKKDQIVYIVNTVLKAYQFEGIEKFFLKDSSFLEEDKAFLQHSPEEIKEYEAPGLMRKSAF